MTLTEYLTILLHRWYVILLAGLIFASSSWIYLTCIPADYRALASITVTSNPKEIRTLIQEALLSDETINTECYLNTNYDDLTMSIVVISTDKTLCVPTANRITENAVDTIASSYPDVIADVRYANSPSEVTSRWKIQPIIATIAICGLIAGLFILLLLSCSRQLIKNSSRRAGSPINTQLFAKEVSREWIGVIRIIGLYCLSALLVITANTLVGRLDYVTIICDILMLGLLFLFIIPCWNRRVFSRTFLRNWAIWSLVVVFTYSATVLANGTIGSLGIRQMQVFFILFPLFIHCMNLEHSLQQFLRTFTDIVFVLACASILLWIFGPILNIVNPNVTINNNWTGLGRQSTHEGYFHLLYLTQTYESSNFVGWRNTGIFVEAPMASFTLCSALCFEALFQKKPRVFILCILAIAIATAISTTGVIVLLILAVMLLFSRMQNSKSKHRMIVAIILILITCCAVVFAIALLVMKSNTGSGIARIDDFRAGIHAWLRNPLFGNGFGMHAAAQTYMNSARIHNAGFSNTPLWELYQGGIVYFLPHLLAFLGFFIDKSDRKTIEAGILFLFLWIVTLVAVIPETTLILSISLERIMTGFQKPNREQ